MKRFFSGFLTTFRLVSRIPLGTGGEADFTFSGFFLPVIGIIVAVINCGVYFGTAAVIGDAFLIAAILIAVQYYLFNLFHLDGLLDSADAFSCFTGKEKRREILKDVHIGSFAFFTGFLYLSVKLYLVYQFTGIMRLFDLPLHRMFVLILLFFSYPVTGRAGAALLPLFLKPAVADGLGSLFTRYRKDAAVLGIILTCAVLILPVALLSGSSTGLWYFLIPVLGMVPASLTTAALYRIKVGGITGDGYGLTIELGELIHMCAFYLLLVNGAGGLFGR